MKWGCLYIFFLRGLALRSRVQVIGSEREEKEKEKEKEDNNL